jgi:hypothetical protein
MKRRMRCDPPPDWRAMQAMLHGRGHRSTHRSSHRASPSTRSPRESCEALRGDPRPLSPQDGCAILGHE